MPSVPVIIGVILSYLLGSVPFGVLVARARGVDIFKVGSGNIGATNVGRALGRKSGVIVFLLDFLKGAVPTALMVYSFGVVAGVAAGLAAFLGHLFPAYLRFRGGKGVATGFGVAAVLLPGPTAVAALVWMTVLVTSRYVSLASVTAVVALTSAYQLPLLLPQPRTNETAALVLFTDLAMILVILRHRSNLVRLAKGTENRLSDSPRLHMIARVLHVLAVGLWFGSGVFFSFVAALSLFTTFEGFAAGHPDWLPLPAEMTKEQGTRLAGAAVGPMFPKYFTIQGVCAVVAVVTALGWTAQTPGVRIHRFRANVLLLASCGVLVGWLLVGKVSELRGARYATDSAVAEAACASFATWHTVSLLLDLCVIALVGVALALAAAMPERRLTDEHDSL